MMRSYLVLPDHSPLVTSRKVPASGSSTSFSESCPGWERLMMLKKRPPGPFMTRPTPGTN
jgi:hypothetical protein